MIHALAVLLALAGLSVIYIESPGGYGLSWTREERYADTPQFAQKLNEDIGRIREYSWLRDAFEEDGELDMEGIVADTEENGSYAPLTLREAMQEAQKAGCYLDPNTHELSIDSAARAVEEQPEDQTVKVTYKYYDPTYFDSIPAGPGAGVTTLQDLSIEVMRSLSQYYKLRAQYIEEPGNLYFDMHYMNGNGEYVDLSNTELSIDALKRLGKYVYVHGDSQETESNIDPIPENALSIETEFDPNGESEEYTLIAAVDTNYPYQDSYRHEALRFEGDIRAAYAAAAMLGIGLLLSLVSFIMIVRFDGYPSREAALGLRPADRLPLELYLILCLLAVVSGCFLMSVTGLKIAHTLAPADQWNYWQKLLNMLVFYTVSVYALLGLIRRGRNGSIFKNTLVHMLVADLNNYAANQKIAGGLFLRYGLFVGSNLAACLLMIWFYLHRTDSGWYLPLFAVCLVLLASADLYVFRHLYNEAKQEDRLNEALLHLSEGNTDYEVDAATFSGREREAAERLNHISTGMRQALSEQVKSERLKADLITNVSHDIRTPLTSIINYVDLLKREDISDPKVQAYIDVLDRKSKRLKNLTEDLLEASKASSGNIKLEMRKIDFVELAMQAGAEFEDKFAARGLELCLSTPEHPVYIMADGRHLWRVLENLYNNAAKYSMERTRVYADVAEDGENAVFIIKNISAVKLNISPEELTERFVRGDVSRTTDGSGLGLSIAKSLAKLQGGALEIEIDGDLYKAKVIFPIFRETAVEAKDSSGA